MGCSSSTTRALAFAGLALATASACGGLVGVDGGGGADAGASAIDSGTGTLPSPPETDSGVSSTDASDGASPVIAADGVCVDANVSTGVVDPDCVYLLGTLQEGDAWKNVLIDTRDPKDRAFGFGLTFRAPIIHPKTGTLTFLASAESSPRRLYEFGSSTPPTAYSAAQLAAHSIIPTPGCAAGKLFEHYVFPDDGVIAYDCNGNPGATYIAGISTPIDRQGYLPIAVGVGRVILAAKTFPDYVLLVAGAVVPIQGLQPTSQLGVVRSRPSGGFMAVESATGIASRLIEIAVDGTFTVKGSYDFGSPPVGGSLGCVLEPSGAIVCIRQVQTTPFPVEGVHRIRLDAPPELLYDERSSDVKIHISHLVTGP